MNPRQAIHTTALTALAVATMLPGCAWVKEPRPTSRLSETQRMMVVVAVFGVITVPLALLAWSFGRRRRTMCPGCGGEDVRALTRLDPDETAGIMSFFQQSESRSPDQADIHLCFCCGRVYDDFSNNSLLQGHVVGPGEVFCKACGELTGAGEDENGELVCRHCGTRHAWTERTESGYSFLLASGSPTDGDAGPDPESQTRTRSGAGHGVSTPH